MDGKITIWFLVTLCAVVGCQSRSLEPQLRGIIGDVIDDIEKVVSDIFDALSHLPSIIEILDKKIEELIAQVDFHGILTMIKAKITKIINDAGLGVAPIECILAEESAVDHMLNATKATVASCQDEAAKHSQDLVAQMNKLESSAQYLIESIYAGVHECTGESWNPITVLECLKVHLVEIKEIAKDLIGEIKTTVDFALVTSGDVGLTLAKCVRSVNSELYENQEEIIANFKKCVDDIQAQS